ncbi:MAG TPA: TIGR02147 family protein [Bdellovibrionota bacterium]|nr:TIGR02147 family protein [Bdellovibrionota bacterium]
MTNADQYSYRDLLKNEFQARITKNTRYSLRAFARDLSMTPQMISAVLNGKRDISLDSGADIVDRLGFDPNRAQDFLDAIVLEGCKTDRAKKMVLQRIEDRNQTQEGFRSLSTEMFKTISNWYHLALLELISCEGSKSDLRWIASRLGVSVHEIKEAVARLIKLELLEEVDGRLKRTEFHVSALSDIPAAALREHARQLLEKALVSLDQQGQHERDVTSMTMSIDPALLPEAKKMILQFRRRLCRFLESGKRSEVYAFVPVLFRLSQPRDKA